MNFKLFQKRKLKKSGKVFSVIAYVNDNSIRHEKWALKCDGLTSYEMFSKYGYDTHYDWMVDKEDWEPYEME